MSLTANRGGFSFGLGGTTFAIGNSLRQLGPPPARLALGAPSARQGGTAISAFTPSSRQSRSGGSHRPRSAVVLVADPSPAAVCGDRADRQIASGILRRLAGALRTFRSRGPGLPLSLSRSAASWRSASTCHLPAPTTSTRATRRWRRRASSCSPSRGRRLAERPPEPGSRPRHRLRRWCFGVRRVLPCRRLPVTIAFRIRAPFRNGSRVRPGRPHGPGASGSVTASSARRRVGGFSAAGGPRAGLRGAGAVGFALLAVTALAPHSSRPRSSGTAGSRSRRETTTGARSGTVSRRGRNDVKAVAGVARGCPFADLLPGGSAQVPSPGRHVRAGSGHRSSGSLLPCRGRARARSCSLPPSVRTRPDVVAIRRARGPARPGAALPPLGTRCSRASRVRAPTTPTLAWVCRVLTWCAWCVGWAALQ